MAEIKYLKGMEVKTSWSKIRGYVVHADREIGITIHDLADDSELLCLNKKETMDFFTRKDKNRLYHEAFTKIVKLIEDGVIIPIVFSNKNGFEFGTSPYLFYSDMSKCAFK